MTTISPIVYTTDEVAQLLKLDIKTVRRKCQYGEIKCFKIGNRWRITYEALREFVEQGSTGTSPAQARDKAGLR